MKCASNNACKTIREGRIARLNTGHPVKFEFQPSNETFLIKVCLKYCIRHIYAKKFLYFTCNSNLNEYSVLFSKSDSDVQG